MLRFIGIGLLVCFVGSVVVGIIFMSQENAEVNTVHASKVIAQYSKGETVSIGYWHYKCLNTHWQDSIDGRRPDARFLFVALEIRNDDRTPSVLPSLKLIDFSGREYEETSEAIFVPRSFGPLKSLNPGVSSRGFAVFDVPYGAYKLEVSGGIESGGKRAFIDLPL